MFSLPNPFRLRVVVSCGSIFTGKKPGFHQRSDHHSAKVAKGPRFCSCLCKMLRPAQTWPERSLAEFWGPADKWMMRFHFFKFYVLDIIRVLLEYSYLRLIVLYHGNIHWQTGPGWCHKGFQHGSIIACSVDLYPEQITVNDLCQCKESRAVGASDARQFSPAECSLWLLVCFGIRNQLDINQKRLDLDIEHDFSWTCWHFHTSVIAPLIDSSYLFISSHDSCGPDSQELQALGRCLRLGQRRQDSLSWMPPT